MDAKPTIRNEKTVEGRTFDKEHLEYAEKKTDTVFVQIVPQYADGNGKSGRTGKILSIFKGLSKQQKAIGVATIFSIVIIVSVVAIYFPNGKCWSQPQTPVIKPPTYTFNSSYEAAGNPVPSTTTIHNQPVVDSKNEATPFVSDDDVIIETPALAANTDKAFGQLPSDPAVPVVLLPGYTPSISSASTISTTLADDNVISEWPEESTIPVTEQDTSGFLPVQTQEDLDYEQEQSTDSQTEAITEMVPAQPVDAIPAVDTVPWMPIDGNGVVPPLKKEYKVQNRSIVDEKSSIDSQRSLASYENENHIIEVKTEDRVRASKPTVSSTSTEPFPSNVSLHSVPASSQCIRRQLHFCRGVLPYSETTLPNFVGDTTDIERNISVPLIEKIVISDCHPQIHSYACAALEPPCRDGGISLPPCRQFCYAVAEGCNDHVYWALNYSSFLDCNRFPESNDPNVCYDFLIPGGNETVPIPDTSFMSG